MYVYDRLYGNHRRGYVFAEKDVRRRFVLYARARAWTAGRDDDGTDSDRVRRLLCASTDGRENSRADRRTYVFVRVRTVARKHDGDLSGETRRRLSSGRRAGSGTGSISRRVLYLVRAAGGNRVFERTAAFDRAGGSVGRSETYGEREREGRHANPRPSTKTFSASAYVWGTSATKSLSHDRTRPPCVSADVARSARLLRP